MDKASGSAYMLRLSVRHVRRPARAQSREDMHAKVPELCCRQPLRNRAGAWHKCNQHAKMQCHHGPSTRAAPRG